MHKQPSVLGGVAWLRSKTIYCFRMLYEEFMVGFNYVFEFRCLKVKKGCVEQKSKLMFISTCNKKGLTYPFRQWSYFVSSG